MDVRLDVVFDVVFSGVAVFPIFTHDVFDARATLARDAARAGCPHHATWQKGKHTRELFRVARKETAAVYAAALARSKAAGGGPHTVVGALADNATLFFCV